MLYIYPDQKVLFTLPGKQTPRRGTVRDYGLEGMWIMQSPSVISDQPQQEDLPLLSDGDIVRCCGQRRRVKILGDYSDAGKLIPLNY